MKYSHLNFNKNIIPQRCKDILIKEDFRFFAMSQDIDNDCVIDYLSYHHAPDIIGCFKNDHSWTVYETDCSGMVVEKQTFRNAKDAYIDLGNRLCIDFVPQEIYNSLFILKAIKSLSQTASDLKDTIMGRQAADDARFMYNVFFGESLKESSFDKESRIHFPSTRKTNNSFLRDLSILKNVLSPKKSSFAPVYSKEKNKIKAKF